jgi:acyl dehydratase
MSATLQMRFDRRPSTVAFMLRALRPSPGLRKAGGFPPIRASWRQHRVDPRHLAGFLRLTGLRADQGLPLLYPHVFSFPLQMVILTHPAHPIPIWNSLQIRNHLLQHRPIPVDAVLDLETHVAGQRILEKGAEVDLHTSMRIRDELVWESLNTFYYRGRFGEPGAASPLARAPEAGEQTLAQWRTATGVGWRFGGLSGDYNGIHWSNWYARRFGFRQAFHHPPLALGQCMARLPALDLAGAQRLDTWLKGPVYYDSDVRLRAAVAPDSRTFALIAADDERPAVLGRWRRTAATESLLLEQAHPGGPEQPPR